MQRRLCFVKTLVVILVVVSVHLCFFVWNGTVSTPHHKLNKTMNQFSNVSEACFHELVSTNSKSKTTAVEDILCMIPPQFLQNFKNPCWYQAGGGRILQCLPYFQVIGIDKSASTDLFSRICRHPHVLTNSGNLHKETMWWSWKRYGHWLKHDIRRLQFSDYVKFFKESAETINNTHDDMGNHFMVTGDGTPMDFWDFSGWPQIPQNAGLKDPKILTPQLIRHMTPDVKLILILRNPVDRLYSDYFFLGLGPQSPEGFSKSVDRSLKLLSKCLLTLSLRTCLFNRSLHVAMPARLHLGFYAVYMKEWLSVFPRDQFSVLKTEEYSKNIASHLNRVFTFLDVEPLPDDMMQIISSSDHKYQTIRKKKMGPMPDKTQRKLETLYNNSNTELAKLLADDRFLWRA